jgi:hypothetical protein
MGRCNAISLEEEEREMLGRYASLNNTTRGKFIGKLIREYGEKFDPEARNKQIEIEIQQHKDQIEKLEREKDRNKEMVEVNKLFEDLKDETYERQMLQQAKLFLYGKTEMVKEHCKGIAIRAKKTESQVRKEVVELSKTIKLTEEDKDRFDKY